MKKGGRPRAQPGARRVGVPVRLPEWLVVWIDSKGTTRAKVIEDALLAAIAAEQNAKPIATGEGPFVDCWALQEVYFDENGNPMAHRDP